jgi:uncharacterized RDD family membrane protein YckC
MATGALATVEKIFWAMVWVVGLMLLAYYLFGLAETKGNGNALGKIGTWFNEHLRPQAN